MRLFSFRRTVALFVLTTSLVLNGEPSAYQKAGVPDPDYDRLDGKGASGVTVQVIEWEGNLEFHVYPAGALLGLALKLDKNNNGKPVMVAGIRLPNQPNKQLIRRYILGYSFHPGFRVYRDPNTGGKYDKIIVSNNVLSDGVVPYTLDPKVENLFPEGHPSRPDTDNNHRGVAGNQKKSTPAPASTEGPDVDDNGSLQHFDF